MVLEWLKRLTNQAFFGILKDVIEVVQKNMKNILTGVIRRDSITKLLKNNSFYKQKKLKKELTNNVTLVIITKSL